MKAIGRILILLSICFWLWLGLSWLDVVTHDNVPDPTYSTYNFFEIFCERA